eukprot:Partr_v1_DN27266_c0_g2_i3_m38901 putative mitogen-activated protein kinase kinase
MSHRSKRNFPKLDFSTSSASSSQESLNEDQTGSSNSLELASTDPSLATSAETRSSRRPRPRPIDLGQFKILQSTSGPDGGASDKSPMTVSAESKSATTTASVESNTQLSSEVYKLNLNEDQITTLEELGTGASGSVFRVIHKSSNTIMAKKIIQQLDAKISKEIMRELQILNKCNSPDIVSLYGAYQYDGQICICMEYMDVGSLEKISKICNRIPENYLLKISVSVLRGLVYLFDSHRIIHRDIKPSNILINSLGKIKICDFGVSATLESTLANTFVGTGAYMSPERIKGEKYSVQCD